MWKIVKGFNEDHKYQSFKVVSRQKLKLSWNDRQVAVPNSAVDSFVRVIFDIKLPAMKLKENFIWWRSLMRITLVTLMVMKIASSQFPTQLLIALYVWFDITAVPSASSCCCWFNVHWIKTLQHHFLCSVMAWWMPKKVGKFGQCETIHIIFFRPLNNVDISCCIKTVTMHYRLSNEN